MLILQPNTINMLKSLSWLFVICVALSSCNDDTPEEPDDQNNNQDTTEEQKPFTFSSSVITPGESIPTIYTCDGDDIQPALTWNNVPEGTKSLALVMDDPDAPSGTWTHWIVFNIPPNSTGNDNGKNPGGQLGENSWGNVAYGGPCPPPGRTHNYRFRLYALDQMLILSRGATKAELQQELMKKVLDTKEFTAPYSR